MNMPGLRRNFMLIVIGFLVVDKVANQYNIDVLAENFDSKCEEVLDIFVENGLIEPKEKEIIMRIIQKIKEHIIQMRVLAKMREQELLQSLALFQKILFS
ncbi:MAG: hypothetical protein Q6363_008090 [Candidatus Njordarchaeota archaeon]